MRSHLNDNWIAYQFCQGAIGYPEHEPAARYLIKKYIPAYWKNTQHDMDYMHMLVTLCAYLETPANCPNARQLKTKWIAGVLGVKPILLYNDPELPF